MKAKITLQSLETIPLLRGSALKSFTVGVRSGAGTILNHTIDWVAIFHNNNTLSATSTDILECRNLFQELARAKLPLSLELCSQAGWPQHGDFIARR